MSNLSRRNFVKGAGLAGAAVAATAAAVPALADEAAADVVYPEGLQASDFAESPVELAPVTDFAAEYTYDVVVIGAGTGGVPAALSAVEEGATACCLQKESAPLSQGGTSTTRQYSPFSTLGFSESAVNT